MIPVRLEPAIPASKLPDPRLRKSGDLDRRKICYRKKILFFSLLIFFCILLCVVFNNSGLFTVCILLINLFYLIRNLRRLNRLGKWLQWEGRRMNNFEAESS